MAADQPARLRERAAKLSESGDTDRSMRVYAAANFWEDWDRLEASTRLAYNNFRRVLNVR